MAHSLAQDIYITKVFLTLKQPIACGVHCERKFIWVDKKYGPICPGFTKVANNQRNRELIGHIGLLLI
jgi:hypothetical protein